MRSGFGAHTVMASMTAGDAVRIVADDCLRDTVEIPAGSVAVISDGGGGFTVTGDDNCVTVTDVSGTGTVVMAAPGGMVQVAADTGTTVALDAGTDATRVRWRTSNTAEPGEVHPTGPRTDVTVSADGSVRTSAPPRWPESVQTPGTGTWSPTPGPAVVAPAGPTTMSPAPRRPPRS
jgi:hypothetical protein